MAVLTNFGIPTSPGADAQNVLMPKLKYRFRVTFIMGDGTPSTGASVVTQNVVNVTRPQLTHDEIIIDQYNSRIKVAGKHTWGDVTLTIRDDVTSASIAFLESQMQKIVNHSNQSGAKSGQNYKFQMKIETLDGDNTGAGNVLDSWHLAGCWISDLNMGDLDYSASEVVQVTATIKFDTAAFDPDNNATDIQANL